MRDSRKFNLETSIFCFDPFFLFQCWLVNFRFLLLNPFSFLVEAFSSPPVVTFSRSKIVRDFTTSRFRYWINRWINKLKLSKLRLLFQRDEDLLQRSRSGWEVILEISGYYLFCLKNVTEWQERHPKSEPLKYKRRDLYPSDSVGRTSKSILKINHDPIIETRTI